MSDWGRYGLSCSPFPLYVVTAQCITGSHTTHNTQQTIVGRLLVIGGSSTGYRVEGEREIPMGARITPRISTRDVLVRAGGFWLTTIAIKVWYLTEPLPLLGCMPATPDCNLLTLDMLL